MVTVLCCPPCNKNTSWHFSNWSAPLALNSITTTVTTSATPINLKLTVYHQKNPCWNPRTSCSSSTPAFLLPTAEDSSCWTFRNRYPLGRSSNPSSRRSCCWKAVPASRSRASEVKARVGAATVAEGSHRVLLAFPYRPWAAILSTCARTDRGTLRNVCRNSRRSHPVSNRKRINTSPRLRAGCNVKFALSIYCTVLLPGWDASHSAASKGKLELADDQMGHRQVGLAAIVHLSNCDRLKQKP